MLKSLSAIRLGSVLSVRTFSVLEFSLESVGSFFSFFSFFSFSFANKEKVNSFGVTVCGSKARQELAKLSMAAAAQRAALELKNSEAFNSSSVFSDLERSYARSYGSSLEGPVQDLL